jgi:aminoglycoside phosphotransferase (APT) family kinase protein
VNAVPLIRDLDETATTLAAWLTGVAGFENVRVDNLSIPQSTGWSNETIFFDAHVSSEGVEQTQELVARIAPREYQVFFEPDFEQQFAVMQSVSKHSAVPMATMHRLERDDRWFGNSFWIMERVSGRIATDAPPYAGAGWLHDARSDEQAHAWWSGIDAMAAVHRIDLAGLDVNYEAGAAPDPLVWLLDHYEQFLTWAEAGTPHPLARAALARLRAGRPAAPAEGPALVWGDARLSNLVYRDFDVVAVLDWEMATVGDPLLDLGWWIFSDDALTKGADLQRVPGFPSGAETAARWSSATGRSTDALDYYVLHAAFRFTVIMLRMGKLLHEAGFVPAEFAYDNLISSALADLLEKRP